MTQTEQETMIKIEQPITAAIRLKVETREKLKEILSKFNDKQFGRKIKPDDVVALSISLIKTEHIKKLQEETLSNADLIEIQFSEFKKKNPEVTKDEFLGKLLKGKTSKKYF